MPEKKLIDTDWISKFKGPIENVLCDIGKLNEQFLFLARDISIDFDLYFQTTLSRSASGGAYDIYLYINRQNVPGIDMYARFFENKYTDHSEDRVRICSSVLPEVALSQVSGRGNGRLYLMGDDVSPYAVRTRISGSRVVPFNEPQDLKQLINNILMSLKWCLSYTLDDTNACTIFRHCGYNTQKVKPVDMLAICVENIFVPDSLLKYGLQCPYNVPAYFTQDMDSLIVDANKAIGRRNMLLDVRDMIKYGKNMFFDNNDKAWLLLKDKAIERDFFEKMPLFLVLNPQESILKLRFDIDNSDFVSEENKNSVLQLNEDAREQYVTTCKCISFKDGSEFDMDTYVAENKFPDFDFKINFTCGVDPSVIRNTLLPRITIRE